MLLFFIGIASGIIITSVAYFFILLGRDKETLLIYLSDLNHLEILRVLYFNRTAEILLVQGEDDRLYLVKVPEEHFDFFEAFNTDMIGKRFFVKSFFQEGVIPGISDGDELFVILEKFDTSKHTEQKAEDGQSYANWIDKPYSRLPVLGL